MDSSDEGLHEEGNKHNTQQHSIDIDGRTIESKRLRLISERPRTSDELNGGLTHRQKEHVFRLTAPAGSTGNHKSRGRTTNIYYLWGDERRAIRRFIEENKIYVDSIVEDRRENNTHPLHNNWPDYLVDLLYEEYQFGWGDFDE